LTTIDREATTSGLDTVAITAEPLDDRRCRFVVGRPVYPGRWAYFDGVEKARNAPLADRLFAIKGVIGVLIAHDKVTVTLEGQSGIPVLGTAIRTVRALVGGRSGDAASWTSLARRIGSAIREHLAAGEPAVADPPPVHVPNESELRARIQRVLDEQVNPVIAGHGGGVSILDVKDNVVYVQMWGGCQGCGLADMTLKNGVEAAVRDAVPEVGEIIDLTNHRAGKNPFRRK
jgi:Fe-S cluster biogenesis protein NfuA